MKKLTRDIFIIRSNKKHNKKYDYSLVEYKNAKTKVKIICPIHGVFEQLPDVHFKCGCNKCQNSMTDIFILESNKKHNNKYDYSLVDYVNNRIKVKIICPEHGVFEQSPNSHKSGSGCKNCFGIFDTESFIKKSKKIHNNKYDYTSTIYKNKNTNVEIFCFEHGIFSQRVDVHLKGYGCKKCSMMTTEKFIKKSKMIHNDYNYSLVDYVNN